MERILTGPRVPPHVLANHEFVFHYGSEEDQARAEECLSLGPGGGFLYLADLGPHDFLYLQPPVPRPGARDVYRGLPPVSEPWVVTGEIV